MGPADIHPARRRRVDSAVAQVAEGAVRGHRRGLHEDQLVGAIDVQDHFEDISAQAEAALDTGPPEAA